MGTPLTGCCGFWDLGGGRLWQLNREPWRVPLWHSLKKKKRHLVFSGLAGMWWRMSTPQLVLEEHSQLSLCDFIFTWSQIQYKFNNFFLNSRVILRLWWEKFSWYTPLISKIPRCKFFPCLLFKTAAKFYKCLQDMDRISSFAVIFSCRTTWIMQCLINNIYIWIDFYSVWL